MATDTSLDLQVLAVFLGDVVKRAISVLTVFLEDDRFRLEGGCLGRFLALRLSTLTFLGGCPVAGGVLLD